ncbi:hypothetical protein Pfo_018066 [Paulownia fortunei]|nr:hypothetical protein Pfo_018066 [Paulownia fortunei]
MENPTIIHFKTAKRILCYLKGTINFGLFYLVSNDYKLVGYNDDDWAGDTDDRKSTTGFVFFIGDTVFTWISKKQPIVTLSICEVEYVATASCVSHATKKIVERNEHVVRETNIFLCGQQVSNSFDQEFNFS